MADGNMLFREGYPRSNTYDAQWVLENQMGPNALWLLERLADSLKLAKGMKVLDLGCGKGITSIFLAREFQVEVWAADLWIGPDHNFRRAEEAGVSSLVHPLRAEAHALPFPRHFFDAAVSIDAYQYFGTDVLYLSYLSRFIKPGGQLGIAVPALMQPMEQVPDHLAQPQDNGKVFWEDDCWAFKTPQWWTEHWSRCRCVKDIQCSILPDGWRLWMDFEDILERTGYGLFPSDAQALRRDHGRYIGFACCTAKRTAYTPENLYNPSLGSDSQVDI